MQKKNYVNRRLQTRSLSMFFVIFDNDEIRAIFET